jgi:hypothetical protein
MIGHVLTWPSNQDHVCRDARERRARHPDLLRRFPLQPLDGDQRGSMARWSWCRWMRSCSKAERQSGATRPRHSAGSDDQKIPARFLPLRPRAQEKVCAAGVLTPDVGGRATTKEWLSLRSDRRPVTGHCGRRLTSWARPARRCPWVTQKWPLVRFG